MRGRDQILGFRAAAGVGRVVARRGGGRRGGEEQASW